MLATSYWHSTMLLLYFKVIETSDFDLSENKRFYSFPEFLIVSNVFHVKIAVIFLFDFLYVTFDFMFQKFVTEFRSFRNSFWNFLIDKGTLISLYFLLFKWRMFRFPLITFLNKYLPTFVWFMFQKFVTEFSSFHSSFWKFLMDKRIWISPYCLPFTWRIFI